ncbi:MAG: hypothetical protein JXR07_15630 [Reichenbachiella sp.]
MKKLLFFSVFLFTYLSVRSQDRFPNVKFYDEERGSPNATLADVSWIEGHWRGPSFGGISEEIWSPPLGGSMMCAYRLVKDEKVGFYEIETITEENGSLILRLKHFYSDLKGWEEKNETVDFKLVKVTGNKVFFDGYTYEKISDDEINAYVVIDQGGEKLEVKFNYRRFKK